MILNFQPKFEHFSGLVTISTICLVLFFVPSTTVFSSSSSGSSGGGNFIDFEPPDPRYIASTNAVEYGRCMKRIFFIDIPGFPDSMHHDVFFNFTTLNKEYIRGFFAKSTWAAIRQAWAYVRGDIYYIDGEVKNVGTRDGSCEIQESAFPWTSTESPSTHEMRYERFRGTNWTSYHVVYRNCQVWADTVLQ